MRIDSLRFSFLKITTKCKHKTVLIFANTLFSCLKWALYLTEVIKSRTNEVILQNEHFMLNRRSVLNIYNGYDAEKVKNCKTKSSLSRSMAELPFQINFFGQSKGFIVHSISNYASFHLFCRIFCPTMLSQVIGMIHSHIDSAIIISFPRLLYATLCVILLHKPIKNKNESAFKSLQFTKSSDVVFILLVKMKHNKIRF